MKKRVLFVCTHNSARSQVAEGLLRSRYGNHYDVASAGTEPSSVHPMAVQVMAEIGIDISHQESKPLDTYLGQSFDYVVTVCDQAKASCPFFPGGSEYIHIGFADPSLEEDPKKRLAAFRWTRDRMDAWIGANFGGMPEESDTLPGKQAVAGTKTPCRSNEMRSASPEGPQVGSLGNRLMLHAAAPCSQSPCSQSPEKYWHIRNRWQECNKSYPV